MKYSKYIKERFSKNDFPVFRIQDLKLALKGKKIKNDYLYQAIHNLMRRDGMNRITRGMYTFHNDAAVVGFAFAPFYYGLENALSLRGISGQGANYTIITSRNVRAGIRTFEGRNYRIQKIPKKLFFGYELLKYYDFWIPVADIEKSFIDMLYLNKGIREELIDKIIPKIRKDKLKNYLSKYKKNFSELVFGIYEDQKKLRQKSAI